MSSYDSALNDEWFMNKTDAILTGEHAATNCSVTAATALNDEMVTSYPIYTTVQICLVSIIAGILSLVTAGGNLMVIVSFRMDRQLQTVSNYFLLSLSVADFAIGLVSMPLYTVYLLMNRWPLGLVVCDAWLSLDYTVSNASVANLLIISFDRYFSVTRPLTYRARRTPRTAGVLIASAWTVSALLWTPWIIAWPHIEGGRSVPGDQCYIQFLETNQYITVVTAVAAFYVPVLAMCVIYYRIYLETERRQRGLLQLQATSSSPRIKKPNGARATLSGTATGAQIGAAVESDEDYYPTGSFYNATSDRSGVSPQLSTFSSTSASNSIQPPTPLLYRVQLPPPKLTGRRGRSGERRQRSGDRARSITGCIDWCMRHQSGRQISNPSGNDEDHHAGRRCRKSTAIGSPLRRASIGGCSVSEAPTQRVGGSHEKVTGFADGCSEFMIPLITVRLHTGSGASIAATKTGNDEGCVEESELSHTANAVPTANGQRTASSNAEHQLRKPIRRRRCQTETASGVVEISPDEERLRHSETSDSLTVTSDIGGKWKSRSGAAPYPSLVVSDITGRMQTSVATDDDVIPVDRRLSVLSNRSLPSGSRVKNNVEVVRRSSSSMGGVQRPVTSQLTETEDEALRHEIEERINARLTDSARKAQRQRQEKKQDKKAAKTLSAILLAFVVTWTPYNVFTVIKPFFPTWIDPTLYAIGESYTTWSLAIDVHRTLICFHFSYS